MKRNVITIISIFLACLQVSAQSLQESIESIISDKAFSEATIGICVRTGDGITLADIDSDNMIMPASNMKLISTGAALHRLGPDHQYVTKVGYDGKIVSGRYLMDEGIVIKELTTESSRRVPYNDIRDMNDFRSHILELIAQ